MLTPESTDGLGNAIWETAWLGDLPVAALTPAGRVFIAPDHLGSPHQITDPTGAVVWHWHPGPFGNGAPTGSFAYDLRFPGQYFDSATKLHYNYFRDYDPRTGRYIESDPIGLAGGINTYAYADGNPLARTDPEGLDANDSCHERPKPVSCDKALKLCKEAGIGAWKCIAYWALCKQGIPTIFGPGILGDPNIE